LTAVSPHTPPTETQTPPVLAGALLMVTVPVTKPTTPATSNEAVSVTPAVTAIPMGLTSGAW
jgi:glycerol uptake facilitator-like aquaporin